jgi:predicted DsbA family dithiol-disulfide isomerase
MQLDIYADTVCPWCLIGNKRLQRALGKRPHAIPSFRWRSFLLNSEIPESGLTWAEYLIARYGSVERGQRVFDRIAEAGRDAGVAFRFDRMRYAPNSLNSHRLVLMAADQSSGAELYDALADAYFFDGANIGDPEILAGIAGSIGFSITEVRAMLKRDDYRDDVLAEDRRARRIGLEGVPTFVFAGRYAVAGAQEEEAYLPMLDLGIVEELTEARI